MHQWRRAEHVINSETEDIAKRVKEITGTPDSLHTIQHATLHQTCSMLLSSNFQLTANVSFPYSVSLIDYSKPQYLMHALLML